MEGNNQIPEERINNLLEENLKLTKEIHQMSRRINGHVTFQRIMSFVYFLLITAPLILGVIYLPSLIKNAVSPYQELLDNGNKLQNTINGPGAGELEGILEQFQKVLNNGDNKQIK